MFSQIETNLTLLSNVLETFNATFTDSEGRIEVAYDKITVISQLSGLLKIRCDELRNNATFIFEENVDGKVKLAVCI